MQKLFDVAVVMPTVLRPSLKRALLSIYRQNFSGRIQALIGIDFRQGDGSFLGQLINDRPSNISVTVIDLGYSTSAKYGGFYSNRFSGALRTILSYAANSKYVAYLDDDDWWGRDHLSSLLSAITGKGWAFSYRWIVDHETSWPICKDEWDSLGPGRGINKERFGGFVSPSNLLLAKDICHFVFPYWSLSPFPDGTGEDRLVFDALLKNHLWAASGKYTCYYDMPMDVQAHAHHAREFEARNIRWIKDRTQIDAIRNLAEESRIAIEKGDFEKAIAASERAISLNHCHAPSLYYLVLAERKAGMIEQASTHESLLLEARDGYFEETFLG